MYEFFIYLLVMSVVTYLTRLLPMLFIRKKIENRF
ncbi:MAG: AzlD domain-containing protein, partial [Clostridia bacterium]|nr:AzlD domain-containing protein [Clostridia bacterium]